jgi:hypothetical protein
LLDWIDQSLADKSSFEFTKIVRASSVNWVSTSQAKVLYKVQKTIENTTIKFMGPADIF